MYSDIKYFYNKLASEHYNRRNTGYEKTGRVTGLERKTNTVAVPDIRKRFTGSRAT